MMPKSRYRMKTEQAKGRDGDLSIIKQMNHLRKNNTSHKGTLKKNCRQKHKNLTSMRIETETNPDMSFNLNCLTGNHSKIKSKEKNVKFFCHENIYSLNKSKGHQQLIEEESRFRQLRKQNIELIKENEHLLYEKQYFKQKLTMKQVECREMERKLNEAYVIILEHQQKRRKKQKKNNLKQKENKRIIQNKKVSQQIKKSDKSSMLLSNISTNRENQTKYFNETKTKQDISLSWEQQTENDFNYLLQTVEKENNERRKLTLRRMLTNKALEMKKINKIQQSFR